MGISPSIGTGRGPVNLEPFGNSRMNGLLPMGRKRKQRRQAHGSARHGKQTDCWTTCRHTFVHRMLSGYRTDGVGCSIETLAEPIGETRRMAARWIPQACRDTLGVLYL